MAAQNAGKALCGVFALMSSSGKAGVENRTLNFTFPVKLSKIRTDLCASRPLKGAKKPRALRGEAPGAEICYEMNYSIFSFLGGKIQSSSVIE